MNAAELPAPQLGRILIAAGLLSEEQLAQALEEQEQTGRRLGEIIVQRGFISGPALANALAEQHGGVLKTEYGFASGLGGVVARRAAAESGMPISTLRPPDPEPMPALRTAEPQDSPEKPMEQEEPPEPIMPVEAVPESEPPSAPPLLRRVEPPAPAFDEPAEEPTPPPAAVTPLSPLEPSEPAADLLVEPAQTAEDSAPALETEPGLPAETAEPMPEPVALRPPDPEPVQEAPQVPSPEPEFSTPSEPEPTAPTEAAPPIPEPVDLRPPAPQEPQPVLPAPGPVSTPEVEPTPSAEATEPVPEPVELRPPDPEPAEAAFDAFEPEPEPTPSAQAVEPATEPVVETAPPEEVAAEARDDRDELIESLRARVEAQEIELVNLRQQLEQERSRKDVQVHVWPEEQPAEAPPGPVQAEQYLLCVPTSAGYVLLDRLGALPSVGQAVEVPEEEGGFTVTKVVRLPRNGRPCAYLQRA